LLRPSSRSSSEVHDQRHRLAAHRQAADHAAGRSDRQVQGVHRAVELGGDASRQPERHLGIGAALGHGQDGLHHVFILPRTDAVDSARAL
jgi:hypothetical protein